MRVEVKFSFDFLEQAKLGLSGCCFQLIEKLRDLAMVRLK
jgi:hypothetical protein